MKKYKVKISSLALRDMEELYGYISGKLGSPATAIKQYERIAEAIESLSVFSERFQIMDIIPKLSKDVRQVIVDHYSAIYAIEADTVTVLRVLYGASDLSAKLQGRLSWQKNTYVIHNSLEWYVYENENILSNRRSTYHPW